ncbi:MAG: transcriptional regulator SlyA [Bacteroidetes bacterium ADurb.Bin302]|nr:MAG: transcriptional regulator SlyA [Bacteroidetes bacterium ADurb.Bin302]
MTSSDLDLEELAFQIFRLIKRKMTIATGFGSLSILQIRTLVFLKENSGANMSDIASFLQIELPSATSLMSKLVDLDLVQRLLDKKDRRVIRIELTENGAKLLSQTVKIRSSRIKQLLSYLSNKQKQDLMTTMQTIKDHLEK